MSKKVKLRGKVRYSIELVEESQERRDHMEQIAVREIALQKKEDTDMLSAENNQPPCGNVLRRHERANPMTLKLAQHRVWMESIL